MKMRRRSRIGTTKLDLGSIVTAADYLPFDLLQDLTFASGATQMYSHDQNYWTDGVTGTALNLAFDLDATGNIVAANAPSPALARSYSYDPLARLTGIEDGCAALIEAFTYDGTGNRLTRQTSGSTQTYGYPPGNHRLVAIDAQSRTYDAMGSLTTRGTDTFTYDDRQRLVAYGATATYGYNAKGERASKTVAGVTTHYVYDEAGHLIAELDPSTTPPTALRSYIWLDDRPVAVYAHTGAYATQWLHIHTDHLGTPRAITRPAASNATVWRWDFNGSAFGDHAPLTDPDADAAHFTFNLRFPGQYFDAESGVSYNYFRDYEAGTGRYVESDSVGLVGGYSTYGYAVQRPLGAYDRDGKQATLAWCGGGPAGCAVGAVVAAVCAYGASQAMSSATEGTSDSSNVIPFPVPKPTNCNGGGGSSNGSCNDNNCPLMSGAGVILTGSHSSTLQCAYLCPKKGIQYFTLTLGFRSENPWFLCPFSRPESSF